MDFPSQMPNWLLDWYSHLSSDERRSNLRWQQHYFEHMIDTRSVVLCPEMAFHTIKMQPAPEILAESREKEEETGEPNPVADLILETLQQAPALRYKGWNRVQDTLSTIPPSKRTTELVNLLCSALQGEMAYWQQLQNLEQSLSPESLRSLNIMWAMYLIMVLTGLKVKPEEIRGTVSTPYAEIEEDFIALEAIVVQLQRPETLDPNDQVIQMGVQQSREILGRLMARARPGKFFAAMTGHLSQLVRDSAPDNFDFADSNQVLTDCALYL